MNSPETNPGAPTLTALIPVAPRRVQPRARRPSLLPRQIGALGVFLSLAAAAAAGQSPLIESAPPSSSAARITDLAHEPSLSHNQKLKLLRTHIKYVFVLFQENRSFDFYFGVYPGADGLYSQPAAQTAGFVQPIVNTDGTIGSISPFKIPFEVPGPHGKPVPLYPTDIASTNHAHVAVARKLDLDANGVSRNDQYALTDEGVTIVDGKPSKIPSLERKQMGELTMAHVDCDVAPFLWQYADRFALFDHFFDTVIGPSGPNAIAMLSGQSGQTEWMLHPKLAEGTNGISLPMVTNFHPFWTLPLNAAGDPAPPVPATDALHGINLTYAALPLSFMGDEIKQTTAADLHPQLDLMDVQEDIAKIAGHAVPPTNWGWYQQGYGHEPNDPVGIATHKGYVAHHNAPQYFGYVSDNPVASLHMHSLHQFFDDVAAHSLPPSGVFYVRGGYGNILGMSPADPNPKLATVFHGDDDHPGYSDSGVSEALLAREINAIAQSPYWDQSVIVIAYDESDGLYDHERPRVRSHDAAGIPLNQGPRIPFLLISPFGITHAISHERTEHSSVIRFVDELFNLIPLADLPDEERARKIGKEQFGQKDLGPADDKVPGVGDLFSGFDNRRLLGVDPPLPPAYAEIPQTVVETFPHMGGHGCRVLNITPTDANLPNPIPEDFNPRPATTPGLPRSGHWTP